MDRKLLLVFDRLIVFYQQFVSPLFPPSCRFEPTCSEYARQAVQKYGLGKGLWLAFKRVIRCHPYSAGGYDPVP
ncbi:membrane protein insertion efficiency factor YidD [Thermatribacter velox]|jgi:hypothetical protein|uniref:Putative membrane protein insertion efficiency factor n=1 Tax=Thermatribacter velox TaxID=3039681 RepID=A0ABZ2YG10_9BACT